MPGGHTLLEDSAVALIDDHLARLIGFSAATGLGDGLLLPTKLGGSFRCSLLADGPASLRRMHSINVASQHLGPLTPEFDLLANTGRRGPFPSPLRWWSSSGKRNRDRFGPIPDQVCGWQTRDRETLPNRTRDLRARVRGSPTCRIAAARRLNTAIGLRFPLRCFFCDSLRAVSSERCQRPAWRHHSTGATAPPTWHRL